jgi:signal transduction histidine kinase
VVFSLLGTGLFVLAILLLYYAINNSRRLIDRKAHHLISLGALCFVISGIMRPVLWWSEDPAGLLHTISIVSFLLSLSGTFLVSIGTIFSMLSLKRRLRLSVRELGKLPHCGLWLIGSGALWLGCTSWGAYLWLQNPGLDLVAVGGILAGFSVLLWGEIRLYRITAFPILPGKEGELFLRDELLAVRIFTNLVNSFLDVVRLSTGKGLLASAIGRFVRRYPLLRNAFSREALRFDINALTNQLNGLRVSKRSALALEAYSDLLSFLTDLYGMATSPAHSRRMLEKAYRAMKELYGPSDAIDSVLRHLPAGVLDREKAVLATRGELQKMLERKEKEIQKLRDQLEKTRAERGKLVSLVAHEIKTPLTSIHTAAELLRDNQMARDEALNVILRNMMRLQDSVSKLLDRTRLEKGLKELKPERADLAEIIRNLAESVEPLARRKGIRLEVKTPRSVPVECDARFIGSVIGNLLENALKYTPAKGRVTIGASSKKRGVIVWVRDTGPGIPKDQQQKIFYPFYQADPTRPGLGLGLALCKQIVEAHGGRIWVRSRPGRGSTFYFTLPAKPRARK